MPKKKNSAPRATAPKYALIDRRNPLNSLPPEERELAREFAKRGKPRKHLPGNWRQVVVTVCARTWTQTLLARALGGSVDWLQARLADTPELGQLIADCDDNFTQRLERVVEERALAGDSNCALALLKTRNPARYGDKPAPPVALQINTGAQQAELLTREDFMAFADRVHGLSAVAVPALPAPADKVRS